MNFIQIVILKENKFLKRIGAELKNSIIIQMKNKTEFNLNKQMQKIIHKNTVLNLVKKKTQMKMGEMIK